MSSPNPSPPLDSALVETRIPWHYVLSSAFTVVSLTLILQYLFPDWAGLVWFGFISAPTNMLIAPVPHDIFLFEAAKYYPAASVAIVGAIGCCLGGIFDYWLLIPLLNRKKIRATFENKRFYQRSHHYFSKIPFIMLVLAAGTPMPFYPFKFLSIAGHYPMGRYLAAMAVGRTPRYFLLSLLGYALQVPTWLVALVILVVLLIPFLGKIKRWVSRSFVNDKVDIHNLD